MTFAAPLFLLALALVPVAVVLYLGSERRRRRAEAAFASPATMPSVAPLRPGWRRHVPMAVYALALTVLALALARPEATVAVPDGRASVMLATDMSASMRATDVEPSRLGAARRAAGRFLDSVPDEVRVGSVVFNDRIRGVRAPTLERAEVRDEIEGLRAAGGTAAGDAIATSVRSIERVRARGGGSRRSPAAIVLLSDGFTTSGRDPVAAAREARRKGVRVYTVALGTAAGEIEVQTPRGPERRSVPPDRASLRRMAEVGDGRFFAAGDDVELDAVYEQLGDSLGTRDEKREITAGFAAGAVLLLGAGGLMSLRWLGRLP